MTTQTIIEIMYIYVLQEYEIPLCPMAMAYHAVATMLMLDNILQELITRVNIKPPLLKVSVGLIGD